MQPRTGGGFSGASLPHIRYVRHWEARRPLFGYAQGKPLPRAGEGSDVGRRPGRTPLNEKFPLELKSNIALPALRVAVRQSRRHVEGARILRLWIKHLGETIQPSWFDPAA